MLWLPTTEGLTLATSVSVAESLLRSGHLVIMPTDTVYGVAAMLTEPVGIERIFTAKGRPANRNLPILIDSPERAWSIAANPSDQARRLGERFWPGALTLVLEPGVSLPDGVAASDGSIGLRVPAHPAALALLLACGGALAVTSANKSGSPSPRNPHEAAGALATDVAAVLAAGPTPVGLDSTVVDARGPEPKVLRQGAIAWDAILEVWASGSPC